jgi:hypothetical protein
MVENKGKTFSLEEGAVALSGNPDAAARSGVLTVEINNLSEQGVVVVRRQAAVKDDAESSPRQVIVKAWEIIYKENAVSDPSDFLGIKNFENVVVLPEGNIKFDGSRLIINAQAAANRRGAIHLTIPAQVEVNLVVNGKLWYSGPLKGGLVMRSGQLDQEAGERPERDALGLALTTPARKGFLVRDLKQGMVIPPPRFGLPHIVAWETMREKAIESPAAPSVQARLQTSSCPDCSGALVKLSIDQTGQVTSVAYLSGDEEIAEAAASNLRRWKFRPLVISGQPVAVESIVPVRAINGQLVFEEDKKTK